MKVRNLGPEVVGQRIKVTHVAPSEAEGLGYVNDAERLTGQEGLAVRLSGAQLEVAWDQVDIGLMLCDQDEVEVDEADESLSPLPPNGRRRRAEHNAKDIEALLRTAEAQGCRVVGGGSRHYRLYPPNGDPVFMFPSTGYAGPMLRTLEGKLRRAGIDPRPTAKTP